MGDYSGGGSGGSGGGVSTAEMNAAIAAAVGPVQASVTTMQPFVLSPALPASGQYLVDFAKPAANTILLVEGTMYFYPVMCPAMTIDALTVNVSTAGTAATALARLGLYYETAGRPAALIVDAGTTPIDNGLPFTKVLGVPVNWSGGRIWCAVAGQGAPATHGTLRAQTTMNAMGYQAETSNAGFDRRCFTQTGVTGALPDPATPVNAAVNIPIVMLRRQ